MRRADRLFQIVQFLRGGRLVTATMLAERLEVSVRTVYRDIADLKANGVPIDGEAGIGYILREGYLLPPLMFTRAELSALVTGIRLASAWTGREIAAAANEALVKIEAVLPDRDRPLMHQGAIHAIAIGMHEDDRARIDAIEKAVDNRTRLTLTYDSLERERSVRTVRPLGLLFWGKVWTLGAWCELRQDFRTFRIDRIREMEAGPRFPVEKGKALADYYRAVKEG